MLITDTEKLEGVIIFWNGEFGFIKTKDHYDNIFFHISDKNIRYAKVLLLDKVTFKKKASKSYKYLGKIKAVDVRHISRGKLSEYNRTIGVLRNWNGKSGLLNSPQLESSVFFYHTRLINCNREIRNEEYFTFSPVRSSKNPEQLFAFFAYPLENEDDINFLKEQRGNNTPQVKRIIDGMIGPEPLHDRFETELVYLLSQDHLNIYLSISQLIKEYEDNEYFTPSFQILQKHIPETYLIQLWENEVIDTYSLESMMKYFHNSRANTKRSIVDRFPEDDKRQILLNHFSLIKERGEYHNIKNEIKTLLDIVQRKESKQQEIYAEVKQFVLDKFSPKEILEFWQGDYIDDLPEAFIRANIDIDLLPAKIIKNEKYRSLIQKIYEDFILSFPKEYVFEKDYYKLIKYLIRYQNNFESDYKKIETAILVSYDKHQKFILWLCVPNITYDGNDYFNNNWEFINIYWLIKYLLRDDIKTTDNSIVDKLNYITEARVIEFIIGFSWNEIVSPINEDDQEQSFLKDIIKFNIKYGRKDINVKSISEVIYSNIEYCTIYHLRLWLHKYVDNNKFDYVGFRESFKKLTEKEQNQYRYKGDMILKSEVLEDEFFEVEPCEVIIAKGDNFVTYGAKIQNIYFNNGSLMLRRENRDYTKPYEEPFSSTGLNRIPPSSYDSYDFIVKVENNTIVEISGLKDFFTMIQTEKIERALAEEREIDYTNLSRDQSYVEDWNLRRDVIKYLNELQCDRFIPKIVNEPKNRYRRLDKGVELDAYEKTHLYTIETEDGYGIVWENIDLSDDRATFIFKAKQEDHESQIEKLSHAIASFGQFRFTLSSIEKDDKLQIFKNNLGYVNKILKQRGKNMPFANWEEKLKSALNQQIPALPDDQEIESIKDWQLKTNKPSVTVRKPPPREQTKIVDIPTWDTTFINRNGPISQKENKVSQRSEKKKEILKMLKEINQLLQN